MLKGHVFKEQIFGNQIFALFINTFLNGQNGVSNNYKNGMRPTASGSNVTIDSGAICIQGRFLEEDTSTSISAGTETAYCKLVIEIDLDKQNTEEQLTQATYKIIKSASAYPILTQNDIVKNNSGIYQYELARFKTSSSGISEFQDTRTFLDFNSIYTVIQNEFQSVLDELEQELENVKNASSYVLKNNFAYIELESFGGDINKDIEINYPQGYNRANTVIIGFKGKATFETFWRDYTSSNNNCWITLFDTYIKINNANGQNEYQLVLMKTDFLKE